MSSRSFCLRLIINEYLYIYNVVLLPISLYLHFIIYSFWHVL